MSRASFLLAFVSLSFVASTAVAEEKKPIEVPVSIKSRAPRPMAAIEVRRVLPALGVKDLGKPFLGRIEEAISKEPF